MSLKKQKIPAIKVKKCLSKIFGFNVQYKNWIGLASAFPNEEFSKTRGRKMFLRQYVWTYCHHKVLNYQNPFRDSKGRKLKNILLDKAKKD